MVATPFLILCLGDGSTPSLGGNRTPPLHISSPVCLGQELNHLPYAQVRESPDLLVLITTIDNCQEDYTIIFQLTIISGKFI